MNAMQNRINGVRTFATYLAKNAEASEETRQLWYKSLLQELGELSAQAEVVYDLAKHHGSDTGQ